MRILICFIFACNFVQGQGFIPDEETFRSKASISPLSRSFTKIDSFYSLKPFCPEPVKQFLPACVGYSIAYAASIRNNALANLTDKLQKQNGFFAPLFLYNQAVLSKEGCNRGTTFKSVFEIAEERGMDIYEPWASRNCRDLPSPEDLERALLHRITGFQKVDLTDSSSLLLNVKKLISEKRPVIAGMCFDSLIFRTYRGRWPLPEFACSGSTKAELRHAITIVGYDDRTQTFEAINSYGKSWGNEGFFHMTYGDFLKSCRECYIITGKKYRNIDDSAVTHEYKVSDVVLNVAFQLLVNNVSSTPVFNETPMTKTGLSTPAFPFYSFNKGVVNGDVVQFVFSLQQASYLYILHTGTSGETNLLFPYREQNTLISSYLPFNEASIPYPRDGQHIEVMGASGTEILYVLVSSLPLDAEQIVTRMNIRPAEFNHLRHLEHALAPNLLAFPTDIDFNNNRVQAKAKKSTDFVLPLIISIPHH